MKYNAYIYNIFRNKTLYIYKREAHIAQLGERQTEDLKVMCSIHIVGMTT